MCFSRGLINLSVQGTMENSPGKNGAAVVGGARSTAGGSGGSDSDARSQEAGPEGGVGPHTSVSLGLPSLEAGRPDGT